MNNKEAAHILQAWKRLNFPPALSDEINAVNLAIAALAGYPQVGAESADS